MSVWSWDGAVYRGLDAPDLMPPSEEHGERRWRLHCVQGEIGRVCLRQLPRHPHDPPHFMRGEIREASAAERAEVRS